MTKNLQGSSHHLKIVGFRLCQTKRFYYEEDWLLNEINMALDDAGIDYDIDGGGRYLINDDNIDTAIDIMENLGAYTECI